MAKRIDRGQKDTRFSNESLLEIAVTAFVVLIVSFLFIKIAFF